MMTPEEMQRTMQFLLENQAAHDARLAQIEVNLNKLTEQTSSLASTQRQMQGTMQEMQGTMREMQGTMLEMQREFREGLQNIVVVSERTLASVGRMVEAEVDTRKRVGVLEDRVDALENKGE